MAVRARSPQRMRNRPRHPRLGALGMLLASAFLSRHYARRRIHGPESAFTRERVGAIRAQLERGNTVHVAGIGAGGMHNSGVALVEISAEHGPRLICNNEEERFSGNKHTADYPKHAIECMLRRLDRMGIAPDRIAAWAGTWDYARFGALIARTAFEELPGSLGLLRPGANPAFDLRSLERGCHAARKLGEQLGFPGPAPIVSMPHHDNHAWFSYCASPFARADGPAIVAVLDGTGDDGAISLYVAEGGALRRIH